MERGEVKTTMVIDNEFQNLIPPLTSDELAQLEASILKEGIRDALVTWNGILIDGHNRYRIAQEHNLPYKTVEREFASRDDVIRWIILNQFGRRNLSAYDRSILALKLKPIIAEKAKEKQVEAGGAVPQKSAKPPVDTRQELAKVAGVSHDTIAKVEKIEAKASPRIKAEIQSGRLSINQAYQTVKREENKQEKAQRKIYEPAPEIPQDACKVFTADIQEGLPDIEDNSIDFIITDPPYPKEYLPLYYDLAILAGRVLKDGGSLLVMCGQSYLPDVIKALSSNLNYHWCLTYLTPGGQSPASLMFKKHVNTSWKPVLWFVKGEYDGDCIGDVLKSPVNDNDKRFHKWGQSLGGMKDIVERFTDPGDIILDPFLGGGTTGAAAVSMMRKFIGTDIEERTVETAKQRIKEVYRIASESGENQLAR